MKYHMLAELADLKTHHFNTFYFATYHHQDLLYLKFKINDYAALQTYLLTLFAHPNTQTASEFELKVWSLGQLMHYQVTVKNMNNQTLQAHGLEIIQQLYY